MKRLFFAIVSLFLLVLAGCEKEENVGILNSPDTLVATIEVAGDTKAYLKEENGGVMNVVWQGYDPISVFYKIGDEVKNVKYVCDDGAGTTTGIFVKADNNIDVTGATLLAAVYPYTQGATYTEGTKVVSGLTMAASYEFSAQMIKTGTPMAYVGNGDRIVFKNAAALVKVTASNIPTGYTSVELSSATAKLSGNYTITFDDNGLPVAALTDENTNANTVTFTGTSENQTVYFPILPGTYADLKVSAKGTSVEPLVLVAPKALTAARSNYYYTTVAVQSVSTQDELNNAITSAGTEDVNIAVDDNLNNVELPSTNVEQEVNLSFSSTSEDISVSQADAATVAGNVNIIATNESSSPRELNITLPNSTVQVSGSSTYSNINASTAENTLVLGSGVTAQKVTVIKGNIKVNTGATLSSIALGTDVTSVIIIDNGGTIADAVKSVEGVTVVTAAEYELFTKFRNGGTQTITLVEDIELTQPLTLNDANANITLNLGTYSLTNKTAYDYDACGETECYVFEVKAGTLNISGTTGSVNAIGGSAYDMAVFANGTGKVNISGGKFTNLGAENDGCDLIYVRDNASVTVSGGEFEAGNKSSDVGNQYVALNKRDNDRSTCSILVTGGKFHKFNPANNVSEGALTNFTQANTMVSVSGTEGNEVYEVIDLSNGYTMTKDIEIATPITVNTTGTIAIDLGTYSLTNKTAYDYDACGETECYVFEVKAGILNISGTTGSVNAIGGSDYDMAVFANGTGKVNISGGKFTNLGAENDGCDLIYVRDNAAVTISGGEFAAGNISSDVGNQYVALNLRDGDNSTASISVTGGKFKNFDPANPGTEVAAWNQLHPNGFVSEGFSSVNDGDYYVVSALNN